MSKNRLVLVDYLKAFCVILVILTHSDFLNDAMLDKTGLFYLLVVNKAVPGFMFLSGYVFALSKKTSLKEQYAPKRLIGKFLRLTIPTIIAYVAYVTINAVSGNVMTINEIIKAFIAGDYGRGSYYYNLMVQFVLISPLMLMLIQKYKEKGVAIIGVLNLIYELIWTVVDLPDGVYRILVFRYLLIIAFGMYMSLNKEKRINHGMIGLMAAIGLVYILLPYFTKYEYKLFTVEPWNRSGMMSAFYVAAVMYIIFALFGHVTQKGKLTAVFSYMGKASYHIMYTQMMYFVLRPAIDANVFDMTTMPLVGQYIADIVVCVASGMVFCMLGEKIFGKIYRIK